MGQRRSLSFLAPLIPYDREQHDVHVARYQISDSKGLKWGWLVSHCDLPDHSAAALGAGLDIAIHGMNLVEAELLAGMSTAHRDGVRKLLYLYFNVPFEASKADVDETVAAIMAVYKTTRTGLEGEKGNAEYHNNADGMSQTLNGYVQIPLVGAAGPIHLNFPKIMVQDMRLGGIYWSGLLVHEATHRFVQTTDLANEVKVGDKKLDGYLAGDRINTLAKFKQYRALDDAQTARGKAVCPKANHISTAQHLKNADSFAWFYIAMLQARDEDTLTIAKRFSGIYNDLKTACTAFEAVQRKVVSPAELGIPGMVAIDTI